MQSEYCSFCLSFSFGDSFGTKISSLGFNINLLVFFWLEAEKLLQALKFASPTTFL